MAENIHPIFDQIVSRTTREKFLNQRAHVFWFTGLSGSGKSTIAQGVELSLFDRGYFAQVIDGDNIRTGLCNNLSFSIADRQENIRRIAELSKLYTSSGIISLCSFISPTIEIRAMAKEIIGNMDFSEIFINTSIDLCEKRDVKGLYKKARLGEIKGFTGIDSPYEAPVNAALEIKTDEQSVEESVGDVLDFIIQKVKIL